MVDNKIGLLAEHQLLIDWFEEYLDIQYCGEFQCLILKVVYKVLLLIWTGANKEDILFLPITDKELSGSY